MPHDSFASGTPSRAIGSPNARPTRVGRPALLLALTLWLAPRAAAAHDPDPWFGPDKALHFAACASIAVGGYGVGTLVSDDRAVAVAIGGASAVAVGAGKEALDLAGLGTPSWRDFTWDLLGAAVGVAVSFGVDWLVRGKLEPKADSMHPSQPPSASAGSSGFTLGF